MKKNLIRLITILFITISSTGCTNKEVVSPNLFSALFSDKGYKITDVTEHYGNNEINKILLAKKEEAQIEYFVFRNDELAKKYLQDNIKIFNSYNIQPTKKEGKNYIKYEFLTSTYTIIISQVDNTIIYVETPNDYKTEVNELLKVIDY